MRVVKVVSRVLASFLILSGAVVSSPLGALSLRTHKVKPKVFIFSMVRTDIAVPLKL